MFSTTMFRVPEHTKEEINQSIRTKTEWDISLYGNSTRAEITKRLHELEREWDVERTLETNAALFSLAGVALSVNVDRKWLLLPTLVAGFLLQHALQGWCPPVPVLRRLGFRTAAEINAERYALKMLRGDFGGVIKDRSKGSHALLEAAMK